MRPMTRVGKYVRGGAPNRSVDGLVVPKAKKVWAQLVCWPTDYRRLLGQGVRLVYRQNYGRDRENGGEGINLVNIQSEEKYIQAG